MEPYIRLIFYNLNYSFSEKIDRLMYYDYILDEHLRELNLEVLKFYWRAVPSSTIISENWKLIYYYEYERYELYNLEDDISERNDLSGQETEIAVRLMEDLTQWTETVHAPIPIILNK